MQQSEEDTDDADALKPVLAAAICSLTELRLRSADDVEDISDACENLLQQVGL
jgi:hypothetical protein